MDLMQVLAMLVQMGVCKDAHFTAKDGNTGLHVVVCPFIAPEAPAAAPKETPADPPGSDVPDPKENSSYRFMHAMRLPEGVRFAS